MLAGELDPITRRGARGVAAAIPDARLVVLEGAGHAPWRDRPEDALELIPPFARA